MSLTDTSVTNPINSFQTNFGRFYAHPASGLDRIPDLNPHDASLPFSPRPSVTNIIRMINKEFLPPYYAKLVAEYAVKNLETVKYQVERFGENTAIGTLKSVPSRSNRNAAIGDEIHAAIDAWCKGEPDPLMTAGASTTAERMYQQWLHFVSVMPIRIVRSEFTAWSYEHGYAGTGDLMWEVLEDYIPPQVNTVIPAGLWIVDTKSGNRVYPEVALQTTALTHADVILDANGTESEMPSIALQGVMHVRPRSIKLYRLDRTDEAWDTFLAAKRIFDWKRFDAPRVMSTQPVVSQKPKDDK